MLSNIDYHLTLLLLSSRVFVPEPSPHFYFHISTITTLCLFTFETSTHLLNSQPSRTSTSQPNFKLQASSFKSNPSHFLKVLKPRNLQKSKNPPEKMSNGLLKYCSRGLQLLKTQIYNGTRKR